MYLGSCKTVDIYCLAATLYYAVTGQPPTTSLARKLDNTSLVPPKQYNRAISERLNRAILKGMALESKDRPQSMQAWLAMLEVTKATPPPPVEPVHTKEVVYRKIPLAALPILRKLAIKLHKITKSPRIIPWGWLIAVLLIYLFFGYSVAWAVVGAWSGTWAWVWAWAWAWAAVAGEKLQKSFSNFHTFLILAGTSDLGLGLGWLLSKVYTP